MHIHAFLARSLFAAGSAFLLWICLLGCTSDTGAHSAKGGPIVDVDLAFSRGEIRLDCVTFACAGAWRAARADAKSLHDNARWDDLARAVTHIGRQEDLAYYYLGRAAEGKGFFDAATTYYKLALAVGQQCAGILNNCDGIVFPRDVQTRLGQLPAAAGARIVPPAAARAALVRDRPDHFPRADPAHRNAHPDYPMMAVQRGEQGTTVLRIYIDEAGMVADAVVETSSGSVLLDDAALRGVMSKGENRWHYLPADKNGKPVGVWQPMTIKWELKNYAGPVFRVALGKALLAAQNAARAGNYEKALLANAKAMALTQSPFEQFHVSEMYVFIYAKQRNFTLAADAIETSLGLGQYSAEEKTQHLRQLCQMQYASKNYDKTLAACNRSLREAGPNVQTYTTLAMVHQQQRRYAESAAAIRAALETPGVNEVSETLLQLQFNNYLALKDTAGQRTTLQQLIALDPLPDYVEKLHLLDRQAGSVPHAP